MPTSNPFAERLVAFAAVEGVLFSAYSVPFTDGKTWTDARLDLLVQTDLSRPAEFACLIYGMLQHRLPEDVVHDIIRSAVEVERRFFSEAISCDLIGMNSELMTR